MISSRRAAIAASLGVLMLGGTMAQAQTAQPARTQRPAVDTNGDQSVSRAEAQAAAESRFARMDANSDGQLNSADWEQIRQQRRAAMFTRLDADRNGSISQAEWNQAADQRAQRMGERLAQRGAARDGQEPHREGRHGGRRHRGGGHHGMAGAMRLDTNHDGTIMRDEFLAAVLERHAAMDSNGDGSVTGAERQAHRAEHRRRPAR